MDDARMLAWRRTDGGHGHSVARVQRHDAGWRCHAAEVLAIDDGTIACHFDVDLDRNWVTRGVEVHAVSDGGVRRVSLRADEQREWWRDGRHDPVLSGCLDVDVAATPLTNTFPINRLGSLTVGEQRTAPVVWVEVPGLRVLRVDQTYERLDRLRWRYRDPTHGSFVLTVDEDGFVIDYEGFATRLER